MTFISSTFAFLMDMLIYLLKLPFQWNRPHSHPLIASNFETTSPETSMKKEDISTPVPTYQVSQTKIKKRKNKGITKEELLASTEDKKDDCLTFEGFPDANELNEIKSLRAQLFSEKKTYKKVLLKSVLDEEKISEKVDTVELKNPNNLPLIVFDDKGENVFEKANEHYLRLHKEIDNYSKKKVKILPFEFQRKLYLISISLLEALVAALMKRSQLRVTFPSQLIQRVKVFRNIMAHRFDLFFVKYKNLDFLISNFLEEKTGFFNLILLIYELVRLNSIVKPNLKEQIKKLNLLEKVDAVDENEIYKRAFKGSKNGMIKSPEAALSYYISRIIAAIENNKHIINSSYKPTSNEKSEYLVNLKVFIIEVGSWVRTLKDQYSVTDDFKKVFYNRISKVEGLELFKSSIRSDKEDRVKEFKNELRNKTAEQLLGLALILRHCYFHHDSQERYGFTFQDLDEILPIICRRTLRMLPDIKDNLNLSLELENHSRMSLK